MTNTATRLPGEGGGGDREAGKGGGKEGKEKSKTFFYRDCSLGPFKIKQLVLAKLVMNKQRITRHHLYTYV